MKFSEVKNWKAAELLRVLQVMVKENTRLLKSNHSEMERIILKVDDLSLKEELLAKYLLKNRSLSQQNSDLLELHTRLLSFMKSLATIQTNIPIKLEEGEQEEYDPNTSLNFEVYLKMTIEGDIDFDSKHPFFQNNEFRNLLMQHYIRNEDYEKCAELI